MSNPNFIPDDIDPSKELFVIIADVDEELVKKQRKEELTVESFDLYLNYCGDYLKA